MRPPVDPDQTRSRLAELQQVLAIGAVLLAVVGVLWWWRAGGAAGLVLALLALTGHAAFLGLEALLAARVNRGDPSPPARWHDWLRAWWREVRIAPQVFGWRQPFRWRALPDSTDPTPGRAPAVFIHGFVCNRGFWLPWMARLRAQGLPYTSVNLEPVFGPIDDCVPRIERAVQRAEALSECPPVLVCHSMGGLAARIWLAAHPGNRARVGGVITIGTPHRGTWLGRFSHVANGKQMRPGCEWLETLSRGECERLVDDPYRGFVCWYANTDNIVFPASTATLPGADNRHVHGAAHVDLAFHPRVMTESLAMLASAGSSPSERTAS